MAENLLKFLFPKKILGVVIFILVISPVCYAKRVALVMGNDNYTSVSKLQKAGNDATAMARELKAAGFTVQLHRDLNYRGMVKAVETFANGITGGDEVVVFFAGHGVQIKNGSYLLPTDIEASSEKEVEKTAYELLALTDIISEAKPAFSLVMIDACRDNPIKANGRSVGNSRGLSAIEPPKGQMVVYSASRGQQALDKLSEKDPNPNGVFTREFIAQMKKPGIKIEDIMREVQDAVESLAKTIKHEQRPAVYNEARGNFYFYVPTTVQVTTPTASKPDSNALELALWDGVKNATTIAEVQAYLNRFPDGFFAELARARIVAIGGINAERVAADAAQRMATERAAAEAANVVSQRAETERIEKEVVLKVQRDQVAESERRSAVERAAVEAEKVAVIDAARLANLALVAKEDAKEQFNLGMKYQTGSGGLAKDDKEALRLYRLSANQGNAAAQNSIGYFYRHGRGGLTKDDIEAERFFRLSANQGFAHAQANLANFYLLGLGGLAKDRGEAMRLIELAANQGQKWARDQLKILVDKSGSFFKDCDVCPEMVVIPAGTFQMGSSTSLFSSTKPPDNEQPARNVSVKSFAIGKFEVTQKQWREIMGTSPSKFAGDDLPVEQISWEDAQIFVEKLSSKSGYLYRLPSEAEWEFAALAGQQTEYPSGDTFKKLSDFAWYWENAEGETHAVGTRTANKFGIFDMHGNVEEWTQDCYEYNFIGAPSDGSARNSGICQFRVVRGGSWAKPARFLRSKYREQVSKAAKDDTLGLRVARDFMK